MRILRIGLWLCVGVLLLPTDEEARTRLLKHANDTIDWMQTFCERNETICSNAEHARVAVRNQAEKAIVAAGAVIGDAARRIVAGAGERAGDGSPSDAAAPRDARTLREAPSREGLRPLERGTVKGDGRAPSWRG